MSTPKENALSTIAKASALVAADDATSTVIVIVIKNDGKNLNLSWSSDRALEIEGALATVTRHFQRPVAEPGQPRIQVGNVVLN